MKKNIFKQNIARLDSQIGKLVDKLDDETLDDNSWNELTDDIGILIDYRTQLYESEKKDPIKPAVVSGAFGIGAILIVLYYEKTDVVTSKAWNIATRMFGG